MAKQIIIEVEKEQDYFVARVKGKSLATHGDTEGEAIEELVEVMGLLLPEELEGLCE